MKNKKNILVILILIALIIVNLVFDFSQEDFSSDPKDNNIEKTANRYQFIDDDNKFQIINNCFSTLFDMIEGNEEVGLILTDSDYDYIKNIENFSIQEIYNLEKEKKGIYYIKMYVIKSSKLSNEYFKVKIDYNKLVYNISNISEDEFSRAKRNKIDKNINFEIEETEVNSINLNVDPLSIPYRYVNDFYIKYKYSKNDLKNIITYRNRKNINLDDGFDGITYKNKEINDKRITYNVIVNESNYEIIVNLPMNYKINIR